MSTTRPAPTWPNNCPNALLKSLPTGWGKAEPSSTRRDTAGRRRVGALSRRGSVGRPSPRE